MKHAKSVWISCGQNGGPCLVSKLAVPAAVTVPWRGTEIHVKTVCNRVAGRREELHMNVTIFLFKVMETE
jgi:hypothetical protein